jgi:hypothetical protein
MGYLLVFLVVAMAILAKTSRICLGINSGGIVAGGRIL